jgi:hypothetical protein
VSGAKAVSRAARLHNSLVSAQAYSKLSRTKRGTLSVVLVVTAAGSKTIKAVRAAGIANSVVREMSVGA